jgi:hypothetical protein
MTKADGRWTGGSAEVGLVKHITKGGDASAKSVA